MRTMHSETPQPNEDAVRFLKELAAEDAGKLQRVQRLRRLLADCERELAQVEQIYRRRLDRLR
jgi:hypothetical protein